MNRIIIGRPMRLDRIVRPALFIAIISFLLGTHSALWGFELKTHRAISEVALKKRTNCVVDALLKTQLGLPRGVDSVAKGRPLLDWVSYGSEEEDDAFDVDEPEWRILRFFNHFYNPLTRHGLVDDALFSKDCWDPIPPIPASIVSTDSLLWAWSNRGRVFNSDFSWRAARRHQEKWMLLEDPMVSSIESAETFRALGHVIHLLQDSAQPQHTRDDSHGPADGFQGLFICGDGAPFEEYCERPFELASNADERMSALINWIARWATEPVASPTSFADRPNDLRDPPRDFSAFWDTCQYRGQVDPALGFPSPLGLAEYANAYFVTDDTMFTGEPVVRTAGTAADRRVGVQVFRDPTCGRLVEFFDFGGYDIRHVFPYPRLRDLANICSLVSPWGPEFSRVEVFRLGEISPGPGCQMMDYVGVPAGSFGAPRIPNYLAMEVRPVEPGEPGSPRLRVYPALTSVNREAHAQELIPKAIAYSAGLMNYFFRGRLQADILTPDCSTQNMATVEIRNLSTWRGQGEKLLDGEFTIVSDEGEGTLRQTRAVIARSSGYPGSLDSGSMFRVEFPELRRGARNFVVFRGTIGGEQDIAMAATLAQVRKRSEVYPPTPTLRTSITWISGERRGDTVVAQAQLVAANGFPLPEQSLRFSVSLNSRGGPSVPDQLTDCEGKVTISYSILLDNGDPAEGSRVTAYFAGVPGYQGSNMRSPVY